MSIGNTARPANRLVHQTSPYLLQHAHNPVDWYPWGEEALSRARQSNRPILLSIGYSACHWCHVMERESFEDEKIAQLMNQHFVCIKVDREERPDLDEIYMQATLALNQGQGGWPMTVFLTPEQQPIFAGTYFPPTDRWGRPGFATVLQKVTDFWKKDSEGLRNQAAHLTSRLQDQLRAGTPMPVGENELDAAVLQFAEEFDARYGGFGGAPKFPPATGLSLLLRCYHRTGDAHTLRMVAKTLDGMAAGGMHDQIGGGFARYSTDERWLVPHFEKMLYDNALLARVYTEAYQVTSDDRYRRVVIETLDYILREMTSSEGGFYSATDADSEGIEGKFFVWTPEEVRAAVGSDEDADRVCAYYDITAGGNWERKNIPHCPRSLDEVAKELRITPDELQETLVRVKPLLYEARRTRIPPGLDDKILTAWNGLMMSALAEAGRVFGERRYCLAAERAADFLLRAVVREDGGLFRTYREGNAHLPAYLEDYASLAEGLVDVYEAGGEERYLKDAVQLAQRLIADFSDEEQGGFFTTAKTHETLIFRSREGPDGAIPSGNAVAASVLARLSFHYDRDDFRQAASNAVRTYGHQIARYPRAFAKSLCVVDLLLAGPVELAIVGKPGEPRRTQLERVVNGQYIPNRIIAHHDPPGRTSEHPLLLGKEMVDGNAALYICRNFSCRRPITHPDSVVAALADQTLTFATSEGKIKSLSGVRAAGYATPGGTARYAVQLINRPPEDGTLTNGYTMFGSTGLTASRLGFGGYRVDAQESEHRDALKKALREGCNVIDTSTNYMDGDSERAIGAVLAELIKQGELEREGVIIVSKIGYVQGQNLKQAEAREKAGKPYPEMVKYGEGMWHCIHPEFLADQLALSLDRLGLKTLDVCLLHNPEYFLSEATHRGVTDIGPLREQFYTRLETAFQFFETQVAAGRLRYYGVSSNTSTSSPEEVEATSLAQMLGAARTAALNVGSSAHHFNVVQCPMNLYESGALLAPNTGPDNRLTLLQSAQQEGIAVLVNRPLNAMPGTTGGMLRLADVQVEELAVAFESQQKKVRELEQEYRQDIAPQVQHIGQGPAPSDYFNWAEELAGVRPRVQGLEHWEQIEQQMIAPHVNQVLRVLGSQLSGVVTERWEAWRERYVPELLTLLRILHRDAAERSRITVGAITSRIDPLLCESRRKESLSRKALWILTSTPGVTCVLNGMRTTAYVQDSLGVLHWPAADQVERVYEAVRSANWQSPTYRAGPN
ncbi:MAG: aldo/keto reductase [Nitrospiraceae bacterium]